MSDSVPMEIASTIQSASINRAPSPTHDINPSTTASRKEPVTARRSSSSSYAYDDDDGIDLEDGEEIDDIPYDVLKPIPRRSSFPPIPDLRFEQSYLASISQADSYWKIAFITIKDQVCMPLLQGVVMTLFVAGWKHWNRNAQLSGNSAGARVRRWWYNVNNWPIKDKLANIGKDAKLAAEMGDYYETLASTME
ncbi:DUF1770 domain containing protein [Rutstroemia sp. NJR-2017a BVV2]|nr:DUF1770 domain containing protein [Rutstroemia sp. NJR-2017a BVV2]